MVHVAFLFVMHYNLRVNKTIRGIINYCQPIKTPWTNLTQKKGPLVKKPGDLCTILLFISSNTSPYRV